MVLGFLGNVAGNLNQDAFQKGTTDELNLQALQRAEQNRLNREFFREKQGGPPALPTPEALNQGMSGGLNLDRFGGTYIDIPPPVITPPDDPYFDGEEGDGTGEDQTTDTTKPVVTNPNQLKPSDPVIIDEPDLSFPKVDPNKTELPPAAKGKNKKNPERTAEIVRRQTIDANLNAITKQFGIRRKAGQGSKGITGQQGEAFKFYTSKEFKDFIYQYPQYLTDVSEDPFAFMEKYMGEKGARTTSETIAKTAARTKKLINGRINAIDNDIINGKNVQELVRLANLMGVDPIAAIAIFGIESDFGRDTKKSIRAAYGSMQVTQDQFGRLKTWFTDPANRGQLDAIYPNNPGMVDKIINMVGNMERAGARSNPRGNEGELVAGLAQLIYNKAIGLDKNLWGAGYQANANKVLEAGKPMAYGDGLISNSDYNTAYITLYNYIANKMGTNVSVASGPNNVGVQVDNTNRNVSTQSNRTNVTDEVGAGKDDGAASKSIKGGSVETITRPIISLGANPDKLGLEMRRAIILRNTLAQFAEIDRVTGRTDSADYKKQITDLQILDSSLYVMQGYDALNQFSFSGNPNKLNAVLDAFTGGSVLIRPRTDGKFDFITPDGRPVQGAEGMTMQEVSIRSRQIFDSKYKEAVAAAAAERSKFEFEKGVENKLAIILKRAETNLAMIQKQAEQLGFQVTKLESGDIAVSQGGLTQVYRLVSGEEVVDGVKTPYERYEKAGDPFRVAPTTTQMKDMTTNPINFGVGNSYIQALTAMGVGTK